MLRDRVWGAPDGADLVACLVACSRQLGTV